MKRLSVIGIDAGGTKTEIMLCGSDGEVLGRVAGGTGNPNDIGIDACASMMIDAIRELCNTDEPAAIFGGVSGAGSGNNAREIKERLQIAFPNAKIEVKTDASNLLASGKSDGDSAALICGTGTALFVQRGSEEKRISGWGYMFDDGGSAYDLGRDALRAALAFEEGLIPDGALCRRVRERLGKDAHSALADIYKLGKAYIASFARMTVECAESGDETAEKIVGKSVSALCRRVEKAISLYGEIPELICGGGLFNSEYFTARLSEGVEKYGVSLYIPSLPQSFGACFRAASLVDTVDKPTFTENFRRTV